jgi:hypothetical protein
MASEQRRTAHGRASHTSTACCSLFVVRRALPPFPPAPLPLPAAGAVCCAALGNNGQPLGPGGSLVVSGGRREESRSTDGSGTSGTSGEGGGRGTGRDVRWDVRLVLHSTGCCGWILLPGLHAGSGVRTILPARCASVTPRTLWLIHPRTRSLSLRLFLCSVSLFRSSSAPSCL